MSLDAVEQGGSYPLLVVLSGPSGVGKDAVLARLKVLLPTFVFIVTVTTRTRRGMEAEGVDYHFVTQKGFEKMRGQGELLEWAEVYGHWYGVPKASVKEALAHGKSVMIKTDVQGAATIKSMVPQGLYLFLAPESQEELERRLKERKADPPKALAKRITKARWEQEQAALFDYVVENPSGRLEEAVERIREIVIKEGPRKLARPVALP